MIELNKSKPVCFLNINGALTSNWVNSLDKDKDNNPYIFTHQLLTTTSNEGSIFYIKHIVEMLFEMFKKHDTQVVLLSDEGYVDKSSISYMDKDYIEVITAQWLFKYPKIEGIFTLPNTPKRGESIKNIIIEGNISKWLVIDSTLSVNYMDKSLFNTTRTIKPNPEYGLTMEELRYIQLILQDLEDKEKIL